MNRMAKAWTALAAGALSANCWAAGARADDLKPFPPPDPGMERFVIRVPAVPAPDDRRVEVLVGRTLEVDCNRRAFSATVTEKIAEGWGFPYYVVSALTEPISTLMACPPDFVKRSQFVSAHAAELAWLRYNPKLPIVVYAPAGTEVRYRIWSAGETFEAGE